MGNTILRSAVKTITWRMVGTIDTMLISFIVTGSLKMGLAIGGIEIISKMILYFIHERVWQRINFGKNEHSEK